MKDMRSLVWRWRDCDEVCEINGSEAVKKGAASDVKVPGTCWITAEDCMCVNVCVKLCFLNALFSVVFSPKY